MRLRGRCVMWVPAFFLVLVLGIRSLSVDAGHLWFSQDTHSESGAVITIQANGPDAVWEMDDFSWQVWVNVIALNGSAPFYADRVHIFQKGFTIEDAPVGCTSYDSVDVWLVEGQSWNYTDKHTMPPNNIGAGFVTFFTFSIQLWWDIVMVNDSTSIVNYSTNNFRLVLFGATRTDVEPPTIPGFPIEAIAIGLILTLGYLLLHSRRQKKLQ